MRERPRPFASEAFPPVSGRALDRLDRLPKPAVVLSATLLALGIAVLDWLTPVELSLAVFHVLPVFLAAWLVGRRTGLAFATAAAFSWFLSDALHGDAGPGLGLTIWDLATKVFFFVVISELASALRAAMDRVHLEARTDALTAVLNRRAFYERAEEAIGRARRLGSPLVLAYLDVDDFKGVNDRFGHETGDRILASFARALSLHVRDGDLVARLGGDEFAVLFPDADAATAAALAAQLETAVARELETLGVSIGFSLGLAAWTPSLQGLDDLIRSADSGMYRLKDRRKGEESGSLAPGPGGPLGQETRRRSRPPG